MRSLTTLACTLTLATGLGACREDDPTPPPPTTAPTAPTTPAVTAPVMPELGNEFSAEGVATFVKYYVNTLNYAALTGDTNRLDALSSDGCESCASYIGLYETTYEAGGRFTGGTWTLAKAAVTFTDADDPSYVTAVIRASRGTQKLASGEAESATAASKSRLMFEVSPGTPRQVVEISRVQP